MRVAIMGSAVGLRNTHKVDAEKINVLHGGNTGNLAFVNAIDLHLQRKAKVISWGTPPEVLKASYDLIVIAGANQLGPHLDLTRHAGVLETAGVPVIIIGLGAQSNSQNQPAEIPEGSKRWLRVIADLTPSKAPNIGLRGPYTHSQLDRLGLAPNAVVIGCPSNFTNLDTDFAAVIEEKAQRTPTRVASAAGQPHWPELAELERSTLDLVDRTGGSCIVQHNKVMIQLGQAEYTKISDADWTMLRSYFRPKLSDEEFAYWCRRNMLCFGNAETWMSWLGRHDFVCGPRFHGIMLAIQAGVPAGCFGHDSRTMEMCQTMGIPAVEAQSVALPLQLETLHRIFPFDADAYRKHRAKLAEAYVDLLKGAGLAIEPKVTRLANLSRNRPSA